MLARLCSLPKLLEFFETGPTLRYMFYEQSIFLSVEAAGSDRRFLQERMVGTTRSGRIGIVLLNNVLDGIVKPGLQWIFWFCHVPFISPLRCGNSFSKAPFGGAKRDRTRSPLVYTVQDGDMDQVDYSPKSAVHGRIRETPSDVIHGR